MQEQKCHYFLVECEIHNINIKYQ